MLPNNIQELPDMNDFGIKTPGYIRKIDSCTHYKLTKNILPQNKYNDRRSLGYGNV